MKLWIGNIAPETSEEEVIQFVRNYAPSLACTGLKRVEGDGSRPAMVLEFAAAPLGALEAVSLRLDGMYWKERALFVQTLMR